ncbi:glycoside hydrolase superfamily [Apodospora peruviana]|uniref:Glycoside hydrolase superfamily n=1 Tax=Apodospora peruviana TaxID=516989 RepID=A0AAE0HVK4_9PEZI|nr:glycoside hydrolase superfamily [Apodospora peruviana]KAK3313689.1 glycoside hydrolase superfamily [Apodospora peruviana]
MHFTSGIAAAAALLAAGASAADKNYLGFNSGSTLPDHSAKFKADFKKEFETAQNLENSPGKFNAVRLYTNIQAYSQTDPIEAFEAAIETETYILLGVWASGVTNISQELSALENGVKKYGTKLTDLIIGISIGSEDLYRNSVQGVKNKAGVGADPTLIVSFINEYKTKFAKSAIANIPVGHVDTWDAWTNGTNKAVVDAVDFVGVDEYPYYEDGKGNEITNAGVLFDRAFDAVKGAIGDKPIWLTETGWPYIGETWDKAVPSVKNAQYYWQEVGCRKLFGKVPTFWYNLRDSNPDNTMKFAITKDLSTKPMFDLTCPTTFDTPTASSSGSSDQPSSTGVASPSGTGSSGSGSGTSGAGTSGTTSAPSTSPTSGAGLNTFSYAALALVAGVFAVML